jgi:hypothetical protein
MVWKFLIFCILVLFTFLVSTIRIYNCGYGIVTFSATTTLLYIDLELYRTDGRVEPDTDYPYSY